MGVMLLLLRQRARRDWLQITLWIVGTALLAAAAVSGVSSSYGTDTDRQALLMTVFANPVILLFRGLPSGVSDSAFALFLIFPFLAMDAAFMSSFLAVRHSRADEEAGRAELLAASGAGRLQPLVATIIHGTLANVGMALAIALVYLGFGFDPLGSWISGIATGAVGLSFLGIGLIAAQVMPTPRSANSVGVWVLLLSYLISGIGNAAGTPDLETMWMHSSWLAWLSPFGWGEQSRPFAANDVGPVLLAAAFGLLLAAASAVIQTTRDLGASLVPERQGRAAARRWLGSSFALGWRLNRAAIIGWVIGGFITGLLSTSLATVLEDAVNQNPQVAAMLQKMTAQTDLPQATVVVFFTMLGILAAAAAVQVITKARQEEAHGRVELVLTSPIARVRWLSGWLLIALIAATATIAGAVVGAALGLAKQPDAPWSLMHSVWVVAGGQLLAAVVFGVIAALVFVLIPRFTIGLSWTLLLLGMTIGMFGPMFGFPEWLVKLAPISSAPTISGDEVDWQSGLGLALFALAGAALVLLAMRRRELATE